MFSTKLVSMAFVAALAVSAAMAEETALNTHSLSTASPDVIVDIDVNNEVRFRDHQITEAEVNALIAQLAQNGCQTLNVRCSHVGLLPYRTELSYPVGFDADHARANPSPFFGDLETYIKQRAGWNRRYADVIRDFNPPATFFRAAHEKGLKVFAWIDLFDNFLPGYRSKFLDEHPHCQWVGKDGKTYFKGLMDYSWPESRAFRVAQARELLDLGADGIHCSMSAHCRHVPNVHEIDFYGYSQPIVAAYQAKFGVDIRTAKEFDKAVWHDLKGEAMVQLYRDLAELCHARGKELSIGLQIGRYTQFPVDPYFSTRVVARYTNHWKQLVDEGVADAFLLGDYEIMSAPDHAYWTAKPDIQRQPREDLYAWAARQYQPHCKGKTRLCVFMEWLPQDLTQVEARVRFFTDATQRNAFDGIHVHEAWDFEKSVTSMAILGAMSKRLRDKTP